MGEPEDIDIESGEEQQPEEQPREGFSIGKLIEWLLANMIPVIIAVVISIIFIVIYVNAQISKKSEEEYETHKLSAKPDPKAIFTLDDFKVNTADRDESHFIRVKFYVAYDGENNKLQTELIDRKIQLRYIILSILNSKQKMEIDTNALKEVLCEEIKNAINNVLKYGEVEDVFYDEFVIS